MLMLIAAGPAAALESAAATSSRDTVTLVSDTDAIAPGTPFRVGLQFRLAPGWHTYWRNPGDAGIAPDFAVTLPPGTRSGPIAWPTPRRVAEGPVMTYAYTGDLLLPVTVTPGALAGPVPIRAHARWLVCRRRRTSASTCPPARRRRPPRPRCSPRMTGRCRGRPPGRPRSHRMGRCLCTGRSSTPAP
jgi:DsbC/DsbD-like thiol-disulfide interchange protein